MNKLTTTEKNFLEPLNAFEESQKKLVKENPFIEIKDNESFEIAKKSRTALLKGRTELQNQQTKINSSVNALKNTVKTETERLIGITSPAEQKQQTEVKRYENIKETERLEREKIREEHEAEIKGKIDEIINDFTKEVEELEFDKMSEFTESMEEFFTKVDTSKFEDLEIYFSGQLAVLNTKLDAKCSELQNDHDLMVANQENKWFQIRNEWNENFMNVTAETIGKLNTDFDTVIPAINPDDFGTFSDNFIEWSKKMRDLIGNKQIELQKEVKRIQEEKLQKEFFDKLHKWFRGFEVKINDKMTFGTIVSTAEELGKGFDDIRQRNFYLENKDLIELKIDKLTNDNKSKSEQLSADKIKSDDKEKERVETEKKKTEQLKNDAKKATATEKKRQLKLKPQKKNAIEEISSVIIQKDNAYLSDEISEIMRDFHSELGELQQKYDNKINNL
ncbi:MAG: hypothetical protein QQN55_01180 [Nitrosopumilus sp.]